MPTPLRSQLLAVALVAIVFACAGAGAAADPVPDEIEAPFVERPMPDRPAWRPAPRKLTVGDRAATIAVKAVGVPYVWGGASPASGFDCSGLVYWSYKQLGIELPHSSYALYDVGRQIAPSRMQPGDLVFFAGLGHVGIYVGRGRMVHAPHSGARVEVVPLGGSSYGERVVGARRIA